MFISAGGSIPGQDEDISPYATFHLLGMREEAKNGMMPNGQNFQTMPSTPGNGPMTNPSTPAHQRQQQQMSQTMNVSYFQSQNIYQKLKHFLRKPLPQFLYKIQHKSGKWLNVISKSLIGINSSQ